MKNFAKTDIMKKQTSAASETQSEGRTMIDYSGKQIYVGIDIHKKDWQVGIYYNGIVLGNHRMKGSSDELITFLKKRYNGAVLKCVYESCSWGFNLHRSLKASGIECIVVNACDVPGSDKERQNKTDKVDAVRLARHHAAGLLQGIHVPDEILQKERNLIRFRKKLVGDLNRCRNRLKALLKFQGINIPVVMDNGHWSKNFLKWIENQAATDALLGDTLGLMLEEVKTLRQLLLKTEKKLRALMRNERYANNMKLLTSVPGVGPLTSLLFLLEIGDIKRFKDFERINNFVGFYPGSNSSGEMQRDTHISQRRHNHLRTLLVESAWISIRKDPAMLEAYQVLLKRMKGVNAIIRIARKLLRRMRAVLLSEQEYQNGVIA